MDKKKVKSTIEEIIWYITTEFSPSDASIKIRHLADEVLKELSKSDWVSVEDGLPEYMEKVLVTDKEHRNYVWISHRENGNTSKILDSNGFPAWQYYYPNYTVTHWKPIEKLEE